MSVSAPSAIKVRSRLERETPQQETQLHALLPDVPDRRRENQNTLIRRELALIRQVERFYRRDGAALLTRLEELWDRVDAHLNNGTLNLQLGESYVEQANEIFLSVQSRLSGLRLAFKQCDRTDEGTALGVLSHRISNRFTTFSAALHGLAEVAQEQAPIPLKLREIFSRRRILERVPLDAHSFIEEVYGKFNSFTYPTLIEASRAIFEQAVSGVTEPNAVHAIKLHVEVDADMAEHHPPLLQPITHIIEQFVPNAVDALREKATGLVSVAIRNADNGVVISVCDNGSGIDPNIATRLGMVGVSTKNGTSERGHGLALVKEIVERHEGSFSWESQWGQGTLMKVFLPFSS